MEPPTPIFGLRLMWGTVGEIVKRLSWLDPHAPTATLFERIFGPLVYVHISRRDKVAQAISLLKAEQSGLWHVAADGSERQRVGPPAPVRYDARRLAKLIFARHGIAPVRVEYEALADSPRKELRKILNALRLPPRLAASLAAQTSRMADGESDAWAARFRREKKTG